MCRLQNDYNLAYQSDSGLLQELPAGNAQRKRFRAFRSVHVLLTPIISLEANQAEAPEGFRTFASCRYCKAVCLRFQPM